MTDPTGCVELFVRVAAEAPEQLAVRTVTAEVTFRELARHAGGVAHRLEAATGDGPGLLLAGSGIDLAAATFGVMATGRALIPTDPLSGPAHIAALAEDMNVSAIVCSDPGCLGDVDLPPGVPVVPISEVDPAPLRPVPIDEHAPALVGFTSGSTGPPKMRLETHPLILEPLRQEVPGDAIADDRVGMLLGATRFAVRRLLVTLLRGSTLSCLDARSAPLTDILDGFARHRVTYLVVIPTYLRRLLQVAGPGPSLPALRVLAAGGEPLDWQDVAAVRQKLSPTCSVKIGYGSTETGRVTRRLVEPNEPLGVGDVPVGWPHPGQTVWIVSEDGAPAPAGEVGEVVVESAAIREGVEAEDLPSGQRRYRTSDLGRFLPDGQLTILGRVDRMLKIGGIRVEPQRVEDVLREIDGVDEVAVVAVTSGDGRTDMVAHLTGPPDRPLDDTIRAHAGQHLHAAAVPTRLVWHAEGLPTLPSGKVDLVSLASRYDAGPVAK